MPGNCKDVDECSHEPSPCGNRTLPTNAIMRWQPAACKNRIGSAQCICPEGHLLHNGGRLTASRAVTLSPPSSQAFTNAFCQDINECAADSRFEYPCPQHSTCVNTLGGYKCVCKPGFEATRNVTGLQLCQNIDECARHVPCGVRAKCHDKLGFSAAFPRGYQCTCERPSWFEFNNKTGTCDDIDECSSGTAGCAASATCVNRIGAFSCHCNNGTFGLLGRTCSACKCGAKSRTCDSKTGSCDCFGSGRTGKRCDECFESYFLKGDDCSSCRPHCNAHTGKCHGKTGQCIDCGGNTGGQQCESCIPGYSSTAGMSADSENGAKCSARCRACVHGTCKLNKLDNSTVCDCGGGGFSGPACNVDVDECSGDAPAHQPRCEGNEMCTNTVGSYTCTCRCGYTATSTDPRNPKCKEAKDEICSPQGGLKAWYTFDDTLANQQPTSYLGRLADSRARVRRDAAKAKQASKESYSISSAAGKSLRLQGARLQIPAIGGFDVAKLQKMAPAKEPETGDSDGATVSFNFRLKSLHGDDAPLLWVQSSGGSVFLIYVDAAGVLSVMLEQQGSSTPEKKTFPNVQSQRIFAARWYQVVVVFRAKTITVFNNHPEKRIVFESALQYNALGTQKILLAGTETRKGHFDGYFDEIKLLDNAVGFLSLVTMFQIKATSACFLKSSCSTCLATDGCGWCASSKACSRARGDGSAWRCDVGWITPQEPGATSKCVDAFLDKQVTVEVLDEGSNTQAVAFRAVLGIEYQTAGNASKAAAAKVAASKLVTMKFAFKDKTNNKFASPISASLKPLSGADAASCPEKLKSANNVCSEGLMAECPVACRSCSRQCALLCDKLVSTFDNIADCQSGCDACAETRFGLLNNGTLAGGQQTFAAGVSDQAVALEPGRIDPNMRIGTATLTDAHLWVVEVKYDLADIIKFDLDIYLDVDGVESSYANNRASLSRGNTYLAFVDEAQAPDQIYMGFDFSDGSIKLDAEATKEVVEQLSVDLQFTVAVVDFETDYVASFVWYAEIGYDGTKKMKVCSIETSGPGEIHEGCCDDKMCRDVNLNSMVFMCGKANNVVAYPVTIHGEEQTKAGSTIPFRAFCGDSLLLTLGGFKNKWTRRLGSSAKVTGSAQSLDGISYYFHGVHFPNNKLSETEDCQARRRRRAMDALPAAAEGGASADRRRSEDAEDTEVAKKKRQFAWITRNVDCDASSAFYSPWDDGAGGSSDEKWKADAPMGQCKQYSRDCAAGERVREGTGELVHEQVDDAYLKWKFAATKEGLTGGCVDEGSSGSLGKKTMSECTVACRNYNHFTLDNDGSILGLLPMWHAMPQYLPSYAGGFKGSDFTRAAKAKFECKCDNTCASSNGEQVSSNGTSSDSNAAGKGGNGVSDVALGFVATKTGVSVAYVKESKQTSFKYNKYQPNCWTQGHKYCTNAVATNGKGCKVTGAVRHTQWLGKTTAAACAHACRAYTFFTMDTTSALDATSTSTHECKCSDTCTDPGKDNGASTFRTSVKQETELNCWGKRDDFCTGTDETLSQTDYDGDGTDDAVCKDGEGAFTALLSTNACAKTYIPGVGGAPTGPRLAAPSVDRQCDTCPHGQFSSGGNSLECTPHSVCALSEYIASEGSTRQDVTCAKCSNCDSGYFRPSYCLDWSTGKETTSLVRRYEFKDSFANTATKNPVLMGDLNCRTTTGQRILAPQEGCLRGGSVLGGPGKDPKFGCQPCKKCKALVTKDGQSHKRTGNEGSGAGSLAPCSTNKDRVCRADNDGNTKDDGTGGMCDTKSPAYNKEKCSERKEAAEEEVKKMKEEEEKRYKAELEGVTEEIQKKVTDVAKAEAALEYQVRKEIIENAGSEGEYKKDMQQFEKWQQQGMSMESIENLRKNQKQGGGGGKDNAAWQQAQLDAAEKRKETAVAAANDDFKWRVKSVETSLAGARDLRIAREETRINLETLYPDGKGPAWAEEQTLRTMFDEDTVRKNEDAAKAAALKAAFDRDKRFAETWKDSAGDKFAKVGKWMERPVNAASQAATWGGKKYVHVAVCACACRQYM